MFMLCLFTANMWTWKEVIELAELDEKKLHSATNQPNETSNKLQ